MSSVYCVAPIVAAADQPLPATFDFWAAGTDCCTDLGEDFHCGAQGPARGGLRRLDVSTRKNSVFHVILRLLNAEEEYNFRQAVRFAELAYHLESVHPLFFEWTADPISEIVTQKDQAFASYFVLNLAHSGRTFRGFLLSERQCF